MNGNDKDELPVLTCSEVEEILERYNPKRPSEKPSEKLTEHAYRMFCDYDPMGTPQRHWRR